MYPRAKQERCWVPPCQDHPFFMMVRTWELAEHSFPEIAQLAFAPEWLRIISLEEERLVVGGSLKINADIQSYSSNSNLHLPWNGNWKCLNTPQIILVKLLFIYFFSFSINYNKAFLPGQYPPPIPPNLCRYCPTMIGNIDCFRDKPLGTYLRDYLDWLSPHACLWGTI